jgi:hypothetical protein
MVKVCAMARKCPESHLMFAVGVKSVEQQGSPEQKQDVGHENHEKPVFT